METIWQDARFALRTLAKRPGFTVVTVLTLALGIGATTVIFGLIDAVLLEPLPYAEPDRLVLVRDVQPSLDDAPASYPEYLDWRDHADVFSEIGAYYTGRVNLTGAGTPERLDAALVSASLLPMLGIQPILGRQLGPEDEPAGAEHVALVSYGFWQRRLGGMEDPCGRTLTLDGETYSVIGVLPPGVDRHLPDDLVFGTHREVWLPLGLDTDAAPRGLHFIRVLGRLRPGVSLEQAGREIEALATHLREDGRTRHGIRLAEVAERVVGDARPRLLILFGAVGLVLLIACANVANLMLAKASARRQEIAVRLALGAGRGRLVSQLIVESLVLAVAGGVVGVAAASGVLRGFATDRLGGLPRAADVGIDASVLVFALLTIVFTALLFGLAPALQSASAGLAEAFRDAGRQDGAGRGMGRLRALLVVAEVALSVVLLVGAGLLARSFAGLLDVELGFRTERVAGAGVLLPKARYPDDESQVRFWDRLLERLAVRPGIEAASLTNSLPLDGGPNGGFSIEGVTWPEGEVPLVEKRRTSGDYFRVMGIPLSRGRFFEDRDRADGPAVAIVNEEFVRRFLPGEDPIGRRVDFSWSNEGLQEIVGVVGDVRHQGPEAPPEPVIYVPYRQNVQSFMLVELRSDLEPPALREVLRAEVLALDPDLPVSEVMTMDEVVSTALASRRLATGLVGGFAAVALLLAMLGIYGVISYSTSQRTQEMGIRMALGAERWRILALVVGQGFGLAAAGALLGALGARMLTPLLSALLFGVEPSDPITFATVVPLLLVVAVAASYLPARRASRVDPLTALRYE